MIRQGVSGFCSARNLAIFLLTTFMVEFLSRGALGRAGFTPSAATESGRRV